MAKQSDPHAASSGIGHHRTPVCGRDGGSDGLSGGLLDGVSGGLSEGVSGGLSGGLSEGVSGGLSGGFSGGVSSRVLVTTKVIPSLITDTV